MAVGMSVSVGVGLAVGVEVTVGTGVGSTTRFWARRLTKTATAPMARISTNNPSASGRLSVISGMREAWMAFSAFLTAFGSGLAPKSVPQTRQRVAFSLRRVPQVGQIFVFCCETFSGLIRAGIIPSNLGGDFRRPAAFPIRKTISLLQFR